MKITKQELFKLIKEEMENNMKLGGPGGGRVTAMPQKEKTFKFSAEEIDNLNSAIARIVNKAKQVLGGEGETPFFDEAILQVASAEQAMVAEGDEDFSEDELNLAQELGITPQQARQATEDQIEARRKYYDKYGKVPQRPHMGGVEVPGKGKVGIGKMGIEDFEAAIRTDEKSPRKGEKFVIKVPESVLRDFQELVQSTKEVDGLYEEARDWYHNIRGLLDRETENDRDSALLGLLIATYSPRAKFSVNLAEAVFMYKAIKQDVEAGRVELLKKYLETFPGAGKRTPGEFRGFGTKSSHAHKVPNFALNLIAPNLAGERDEHGDVVINDLYEWNSTIDTWMIDAFYPNLRKASTKKEWDKIKGDLMSNVMSYRYMAMLVAQEAAKLNLLPHELQALIWVASQIRQTGSSGQGVTTQFAFNQLRQSISDVAIIKEDLAALKDLEEKDWMGTIISTIDRSGFAEAASYVREQGKGIRSVAGKGPKGSPFGFFPSKSGKKPPKDSSIKEAKKNEEQEKTEVQTPYGIVQVPAKNGEPKHPYSDPAFAELATFYVMHEIIQMLTGKFNNLYDCITLYLDPEFSTDKAVKHILGKFDPDATATKDYFLTKETLMRTIMEVLKEYKL